MSTLWWVLGQRHHTAIAYRSRCGPILDPRSHTKSWTFSIISTYPRTQYPREETPCRIEPLFRLPQLSSLASRVFRLTPWPIEADTVEAAIVEASIVEPSIVEASIVEASTVEASIVEASIVEASTVEASIVEASIVEAPIMEASIVAAMCAVAFTARPHADITLTRPAIKLTARLLIPPLAATTASHARRFRPGV